MRRASPPAPAARRWRLASVDLSGLDPRLAPRDQPGAGLGLSGLGPRLPPVDVAGGPPLAESDRGARDEPPPPVETLAATDVDNPLLGPSGAAVVYGPQKGAGPDDVGPVDAALANFADRVRPGARSRTALGPRGGRRRWPRLRPDRLLRREHRAGDRGRARPGRVRRRARRRRPGDHRRGPDRPADPARQGRRRGGGRARAAGVPAYAIGGSVDPAVRDEWPRFEAAGLAGVESTLERPLPLAEALDPAGARTRLAAAAERLARALAVERR